MITVKACIYRHHRRQDGTYPVKLRITLGGVSRHLPTTSIARPEQLTRSLKPKDPELVAALDELCASIRRSVAKISPFALESMTVDDAVAFIKADQQAAAGVDFWPFAEEYVTMKNKHTRRNYVYALESLHKFAGSGRLDCRRITRPFLQKWVDTIGGAAACRSYVTHVGAIFTAARLRYNDEAAGVWAIPQDPFKGLKLPRYVAHGQKAQSIETIQQLIDATDGTLAERRAIDIFLLSLCTQGTNLVDLYYMKPPQDGLLHYQRQKVTDRRLDGAHMVIRLEPCAVALASRWLSGKGSRWLRLSEIFSNSDNAIAGINRPLANWLEKHQLPRFTYYAARKTWATLARSARIRADKDLVDEALAHVGDHPLVDVYAERDPSLQWEINAKVLALFDWSAML